MPANPDPQTATPAGESVAVVQSDRDAAADLAQWLTDAQKEWDGMATWFAADTPRAFREGGFDAHEFVQAFARHRLAHAKEQAAVPSINRALVVAMEDVLNEPPRTWDIEPVEVRDFRHQAYRVWEPLCRAILALAAPASSVGEGAWMDMQSAPRDGTEILLFHKHHGQIQGRFAPGEWSEDTPISPAEYSGAVWVLGDDLAQEEVEELPEGAPLGIKFYDGQLIGWRPLYGLAPDRAPAPADLEAELENALCAPSWSLSLGHVHKALAALRSPDDLAKGRGE